MQPSGTLGQQVQHHPQPTFVNGSIKRLVTTVQKYLILLPDQFRQYGNYSTGTPHQKCADFSAEFLAMRLEGYSLGSTCIELFPASMRYVL